MILGKITVIDDEACIRIATGSLVRSLGYETRAFASAEEFLASPEWRDSDCIISDVQMPGMGGIGLYQELVRRSSAIPFIFITAFSEEGIRQKLGDGVRILHKPFDAEALADHIDTALAAGGASGG